MLGVLGILGAALAERKEKKMSPKAMANSPRLHQATLTGSMAQQYCTKCLPLRAVTPVPYFDSTTEYDKEPEVHKPKIQAHVQQYLAPPRRFVY